MTVRLTIQAKKQREYKGLVLLAFCEGNRPVVPLTKGQQCGKYYNAMTSPRHVICEPLTMQGRSSEGWYDEQHKQRKPSHLDEMMNSHEPELPLPPSMNTCIMDMLLSPDGARMAVSLGKINKT